VFTVVGSGFGLYGYLPALVETFGEPVLLPEAYRAKVDARPELERYREAIRWVPDADAALAQATGVVVATPPHRQVAEVKRCLSLAAIDSMVLEKPLAPTPAEAHALLEALRHSGRRYRLGYTFLQTRWAESLAWPQRDGGREVAITWTFMAHHFAHGLHNWKRIHAEGGGALRFFGVHLLALLARAGYRDVKESVLEGAVPAEPERWRAVFTAPRLPDCRVLVDARCEEARFRIEAGTPLVDLSYPYSDEPAAREADRRIGVLQRFLRSLDAPQAEFDRFYAEVDALWRAVEGSRP